MQFLKWFCAQNNNINFFIPIFIFSIIIFWGSYLSFLETLDQHAEAMEQYIGKRYFTNRS